MDIGAPTCMELFEGKIIMGDSEGNVSIIDRHGIVIERVRVMESVRGMSLSGRYLIVHGSKVAKCVIS